jgi:hypothetical protein
MRKTASKPDFTPRETFHWIIWSYVYYFMSLFPADLFEQLVGHGASIQKKVAQSDAQRPRELESVKRETDALAAEAQQTHQTATDAQRELTQRSDRDKQKLIDKKRKYDEEKLALERSIRKLRQEIERDEPPKESSCETDASLGIFRAIAPIRFTEFTDARVAGIIAMGHPDSTISFDCDRKHGNQAIDAFWEVLGRVSEAE